MKRLYDFKCDKCDVTEEYFAESDTEVPCPCCGQVMRRLISCSYKININEPWRMAKDRMS